MTRRIRKIIVESLVEKTVAWALNELERYSGVGFGQSGSGEEGKEPVVIFRRLSIRRMDPEVHGYGFVLKFAAAGFQRERRARC